MIKFLIKTTFKNISFKNLNFAISYCIVRFIGLFNVKKKPVDGFKWDIN